MISMIGWIRCSPPIHPVSYSSITTLESKTEFFHSLGAPFGANAKTIIDIGYYAADAAVQQP